MILEREEEPPGDTQAGLFSQECTFVGRRSRVITDVTGLPFQRSFKLSGKLFFFHFCSNQGPGKNQMAHANCRLWEEFNKGMGRVMRKNKRRVIPHLSYGGAITTLRLKGAQREGAVTVFSLGTQSPKVTLQGKSQETDTLTSLSSPLLIACHVPFPPLKLNWKPEAREPVVFVPLATIPGPEQRGHRNNPEARRRETRSIAVVELRAVVGNHVSGTALDFTHTSLATTGRI